MAQAEQPDTVDDVWANALSVLSEGNMLSAQHRSFIRMVKPLAVVEDNVFLAVAEDFTKGYIESTIRGPLTEALSEVLGRDVRIAVTVDSSVSPPELSPSSDDYEPTPRRSRPERAPTAIEDPHLNPRYTFDTFVIGSSNRFAHAAALAVA
ncbi:MAG: DnaA/Hda family protein, partial [Demequina sp.]